MNIRRANFKDLPAVLPLLKQFHYESLSDFGLGFDEKNAMQTMETFVKNQVGIIAEIDGVIVGVVAGILSPYYLNYSVTIFQEAIWYIKKEFRGGLLGMRLLNFIEDFCEEKNYFLVMVNMANLNNQKMSDFYMGRGYRLMENQFIRGQKNA